MKDPRNIVVKTLMNPDEFTAFAAACEEEDVSQSKKLRDLGNAWVANRNDRRRQGRREWPSGAHNQAMFLPGRVNYGAAPQMRMRM